MVDIHQLMSIPIVVFGCMRKHMYVCMCMSLVVCKYVQYLGFHCIYRYLSYVLCSNRISATYPDSHAGISYLKSQIG